MNIITKLTAALLTTVTLGFAHGDVTPQAMDIKGLEKVDPEAITNPYRGNKTAIAIGKSGSIADAFSKSVIPSKSLIDSFNIPILAIS